MKLGIHSNSVLEPDQLELIRSFFSSYDDAVLFTTKPHMFSNPHIAILPVFYMYFFDGTIIFTDEPSLQKNIRSVKSQDIFLLVNNTITNIDKGLMINELQ